ncbi:MAG: TlpA family protein disulfide reductase [Planctomycetes bacterium]|nr:TlpA family protein disulfide reductase [Planctomycetota bacterium]
MKRTRIVSFALAAALLAGCGDSKPAPKTGKKGPFPVERTGTPPPTTAGTQTTPPVTVETHNPDKDPKPKPVDKPPVVAPPPVAKKGQEVGQAAPEVVLEDTAGQVFMLSSFRGKQPVLLVFGAIWCPKCSGALPALIDTNKVFASRGLVVAEVMLGDGQDAEHVKKYAQERGASHRFLPDVRQLSRSRYGYNVDDMPLHVLIGRDGTVLANSHTVPTDAEIEKALK